MAAELVAQHNRLRAEVPATNMQRMSWSRDLAAQAQRYAEQCDFNHSSKGSKVIRAGENIWAASYANYSNAVRLWFDEVYDPGCGCGTTFKYCCGHYTQVVWAASRLLGCGAARCSSVNAAPGQRFILVCHYNPPGNFIGLPAFTFQLPGQPACSACPSQRKRCWNNQLCY